MEPVHIEGEGVDSIVIFLRRKIQLLLLLNGQHVTQKTL